MTDGGRRLRAWVARSWPEIDWRDAAVLTGAFHDVVLARTGEVARTATGRDHKKRLGREVSVLEITERLDLPLPTPRLIGPLAGDAGRTGVLLRGAPVVPQPDRRWDDDLAAAYGRLLDAFVAVPLAAAAGLPAPRDWCGGTKWPSIVEKISTDLPASLRARATQIVDDALAAESTVRRATFVHGDLGPHNVLWQGGAPSGLIDLDHAAIGDPAIDVAPLIGFHGTAAVATIVSGPLLQRARLHRASLPLQVAAAAHLQGNAALRDHALGNFCNRARAGTLYDPRSGDDRP